MFKKIAILLTAVTLTLSTFLPLSNTYAKANTNEIETLNMYNEDSLETIKNDNILLLDDSQNYDSDEVQPYGVKKWVTVQAMKAVSKALRSGGAVINKIAKEIGAGTPEAKAFLKHTDDIADALDELIDRGDVVEDAIIETVFGYLMEAGVKSSHARTIAAVFTFFAF